MTLAPPGTVNIMAPRAGEVSIVLPYDEAEILLRAVGTINHGSLRAHAPELLKAVDKLVDEFGRSNVNDARRYLLDYRNSQHYILDDQER